MKFLLAVSSIILLSACVHKKVIVNRLEGKWTLEKILNPDGSYDYFNGINITFQKGKADGKTYLDCTYDSAGVESQGSYLVSKNGEKLYVNYDLSNVNNRDTFNIEDSDKKSLVIRNDYIVQFWKKN